MKLTKIMVFFSIVWPILTYAQETPLPNTTVQSNDQSTTVTTTVPTVPNTATTVTTTTAPATTPMTTPTTTSTNSTTTITTPVPNPASPTTQTVSPSVDPQQVAREDARITSDIRNLIASDNSLASTNITATVSNGIVTLTGTVDNQSQADHVDNSIRSLGGVKDVKSNLTIKGSASSTLGY